MREDDFKMAKLRLDKYHETEGHRHTPERYEVLRILYNFSSRITFEDIEKALEQKAEFHISRGTIYNSLKLFIELGLIRCTRINSRSYYDIEYKHNSCIQVCRVCGKTRVLSNPEQEKLLEIFRPKRFDLESFTLRFDGICSTCKALKTKQEKKISKKTPQKSTNSRKRTKQK